MADNSSFDGGLRPLPDLPLITLQKDAVTRTRSLTGKASSPRALGETTHSMLKVSTVHVISEEEYLVSAGSPPASNSFMRSQY